MTQKKRNTRYVTEVGTAIYPHLIQPDTRFNAEGEYKLKLKLSPDAQLKDSKGESKGSMQEFLDSMMERALAKAKEENPNERRMKQADAPYDLDDSGNLVVNMKLKARVSPKNGEPFEQRPALFDAKGKPFDGETVWGGSELKVSFEIVPFYTKMIGAGITLRLKACQIIELKKGGDVQAESYGFGEEEGYESSGTPAAQEGFASEEDDDDSDDIPFDTATENGDF